MLTTSNWGTTASNGSGITMQVLMLRGTMTSVGNARAGLVVELPEAEAVLFIKQNRASAVVNVAEPVEVNRSVGLEVSDDKPTKRGRPRKNHG
jgi:hypothetical protein